MKTGDQVIVIHSASELEKRLEEASRTSRLAILFFSKARPRRYISLYASLTVKYPKVVFLKVDIEEGPNAEGMAVDRGIRKFPTFLIYKSGKEVDKVVGVDAIELDRKIPLHSRKHARRKQAKSLSEYEFDLVFLAPVYYLLFSSSFFEK
jgi:suppressor of tumorigenicity protein 13